MRRPTEWSGTGEPGTFVQIMFSNGRWCYGRSNVETRRPGSKVIEAQALLNRNGAILDADGDFGGGTEAAVREFQAAVVPSLSVTGVIDGATWQALRALPEPSSDIPVRAVPFIGREESAVGNYTTRWAVGRLGQVAPAASRSASATTLGRKPPSKRIGRRF